MKKKDESWKEEWIEMPEFVQNKKEPYAKIVFRFEDEESLQEFAELIGQKLNKKTKSSWHPYKPHKNENKKEWVDEP